MWSALKLLAQIEIGNFNQTPISLIVLCHYQHHQLVKFTLHHIINIPIKDTHIQFSITLFYLYGIITHILQTNKFISQCSLMRKNKSVWFISMILRQINICIQQVLVKNYLLNLFLMKKMDINIFMWCICMKENIKLVILIKIVILNFIDLTCYELYMFV
jgi:hypothetical protein